MINRVLLLIAIPMLFYTCGEGEPDFSESIFENANIAPVTTLITTDVNPTNSTVTFQWTGNEFAKAFNYRLVLSGYDDILVPQDYFEWLDGDGWINGNTSIAYGELIYSSYVNTPFDSSSTSNGLINLQLIKSILEARIKSFIDSPLIACV